ncbi:hypothetical protein BDW02DRAFT_489169 [Decorospora gaudefroyi]|uniref:Uncharacterized protein n=1 Tax=Decorospora gaudefroyi TaxID=184978 RepID=A0A6A5KU36_9PLEO|nr:hypothetical protein BDW02DRAFT_489169 [Decorospora gaudefroyi]
MNSAGNYQQLLGSLGSLPEHEAAEALRKALLKGTRSGGLTLTRADIYEYFEHVHHYYGCPEDEPCDHDIQTDPLRWEKKLLYSVADIVVDIEKNGSGPAFRLWLSLLHAMNKYEVDIRKRWLKKSVAQRKAVLLAAWPTLSARHRPDMDEVVLNACPHERYSEALGHYTFPHMNLEDLTMPNSLLILLNARARHPPWKFALLDYELAPLIHLRPALLEETKLTMGLMGAEYGQIIKWNTEAEAAESMSMGDTIHPLPGSHILSMHAILYKALFLFVQEILPDKDSDLIIDFYKLLPPEQWPEPPTNFAEPPALTCDEQEFTSLNAIVREASYRVPALADLGRLEVLVSACKNAAEDHIWMLREDPEYFHECVFEHKEHRPELLRGQECGMVHINGREEHLWPRVLQSVTTNCYIDLFMWNELHVRISRLERYSNLYKEHLGCGVLGIVGTLPRDFAEALVETWFFLEAFQLEIIQELQLAWSSSLEVRAYFAQVCKHNEEDEDIMAGITFSGKHGRKRDKELERIFNLFKYLWDPPVRQTLKVHTLVETLEHLLQTNARANSLTSPLSAALISKLSIVSECLRQLNFFLPWAKEVEYVVKKHQTALLLKYATNLSRWNATLNTTFAGTNLADLGKPGSKFRYPVKKRRSRLNVERLRSAEAALDAFWHAADAHYRKCTGSTPHDLVSVIIQERTLQRTPPWSEPDKTSTPSTPVEYIYIPVPNSLHDPTKQITGRFDKLNLQASKKTKSHGFAAPNKDDSIDEKPTTKSNSPEVIFHLSARAHKVFKTLFHSPLSHEHPGDIRWQDFLHAMVAVGFSAQKLQGSAWQFTPRDLDVGQPIQLHEPHPTHKLPFTWARRFGRRLARTYGWRGDMFLCA